MSRPELNPANARIIARLRPQTLLHRLPAIPTDSWLALVHGDLPLWPGRQPSSCADIELLSLNRVRLLDHAQCALRVYRVHALVLTAEEAMCHAT